MRRAVSLRPLPQPPAPHVLAGCTRRIDAGVARADLVICCTPLLHTRALGLRFGRGRLGPALLVIGPLLLRLPLALLARARISCTRLARAVCVTRSEAVPGLCRGIKPAPDAFAICVERPSATGVRASQRSKQQVGRCECSGTPGSLHLPVPQRWLSIIGVALSRLVPAHEVEEAGILPRRGVRASESRAAGSGSERADAAALASTSEHDEQAGAERTVRPSQYSFAASPDFGLGGWPARSA